MKRLLLLPIILVLFLVFVLVGYNAEWLGGWDYRIELEIADYAGDFGGSVSWFPATIFLKDANGDSTKVFLEVGANSRKIAITKNDGTTELKGEIEGWNYDSGTPANSTAVIHTSASSWTIDSNTSIWLYYDNYHADNANIGIVSGAAPSSDVWDSDFIAIHHLKESGDGSADEFKDSTSNANHGTGGAGKFPVQVDGKIGKAQDFVRSGDPTPHTDGDYIGFVNFNSIKPIVNRMYELWFYPTASDEATILGGDDGGDGNILRIAGGNIAVYNAGTWTIILNGVTATGVTGDSGLSVNLNQWNRLAAYQTGTTTWDNFYIGRALASRHYEGSIDEFRISGIVRSTTWRRGSDNSLSDTLFTYGSEESLIGASTLWFGTNQ